MNWLDILIVGLMVYNSVRGYSLGLVLSFFDLLQIIVSLSITRNYYIYIYQLIEASPLISKVLRKLIYFCLRLIFFRRNSWDPGFLENLLKTDIISTIMLGLALLFTYKVGTMVIDILFSVFSFLINVNLPSLVDRLAGLVFGILKALLMVYIVHMVLGPVLEEMPATILSKAFGQSLLLDLILDRS